MLFTVAIGYLASADLLFICQTIEFGSRELRLMAMWIQLAIAIGVVLPVITFVIGFKHLKLQKVFGFYFLILGTQIVAEQLFSYYWMPSLVVPIGKAFFS